MSSGKAPPYLVKLFRCYSDPEGERNVSRTTLRKLDAIEDALVGLTRNVSQIETQTLVSQAEMPRKFAEIAALVMREELAKRKSSA